MNRKFNRYLIVAGAVLILLIPSLLLYSARSAAFRDGTDLKLLAMSFQMYASQNAGEYPPTHPEASVLFADPKAIGPYIVDGEDSLLSPADKRRIDSTADKSIDSLSHTSSYVYFGQPLRSDEEVGKYLRDHGGTDDRQLDQTATESARTYSEHDLLFMEVPRPYPGSIGLYLTHWIVIPLSSGTMGGLVAYADGSVEFLTYPGPWPMTEATVQQIREFQKNMQRRAGPQER